MSASCRRVRTGLRQINVRKRPRCEQELATAEIYAAAFTSQVPFTCNCYHYLPMITSSHIWRTSIKCTRSLATKPCDGDGNRDGDSIDGYPSFSYQSVLCQVSLAVPSGLSAKAQEKTTCKHVEPCAKYFGGAAVGTDFARLYERFEKSSPISP
jgi:hypothetical protein